MGGARFVAVVTVWVKCPGSTFLLGICPGISLGYFAWDIAWAFSKWNWNWTSYCNIAHFYSASSAKLISSSYPREEKVMARRSRSAISFDTASTLQRIEELVLEIQSCGSGLESYNASSCFRVAPANIVNILQVLEVLYTQHLSLLRGGMK